MKPGTIVVCLPIGEILDPWKSAVEWLPAMDEKTPYMIRNTDGGMAVRFEEGVIGRFPHGELSFPINYVREILPPGEISEEIKEVLEQENLISN